MVIVFTVVPKNKGLKRFTYLALEELGISDNLINVRGEDVPFWVESLLEKNKEAIGLTGEDLFTEYCLRIGSQLKILKKVEWDDPAALFRKPTLCLLGPSGRSLDQLPECQTVFISSKYRFIAGRYLSVLEKRGLVFKKEYVSGSAESSFSTGLADLVIDIVYTGSSMSRLGLSVLDKIFPSDFVIIGGKNESKNI